ncbi:MAG: hypothetical protein QHH07_00210 [Sedimentisphaerales bacterium]|jgi:hypothetical protein|nr:hypothetical protein [Sedimentisphaerales bacterium]
MSKNKIRPTGFTPLAGLPLAILLLLGSACQPRPVELTVHTDRPGPMISQDSLGLSYETLTLLPDEQGRYYFDPNNRELIKLLDTLGIRHIRIGGNSADAPNIPLPQEQDIRIFFSFARAAGVKVIYTFRLQDGDPEYAAKVASIIRDCHGGTLQYLAIGNEPSYYKDPSLYASKWAAIRDAVIRQFPDALFCGPDQNPSPELCRRLIRDFSTGPGRLALITQHSYPLGCAYQNPMEALDANDLSVLIPQDPVSARQGMLSREVWAVYEKIHGQILEGIKGHDMPYRLTEVNNYWFGGLKGASDTYAAALWAIDYIYWWLWHGAVGLNFHTGDRCGGRLIVPCQYAAFIKASDGYQVRPLGYGLKVFALGGQGRLIHVDVKGPDRQIVAYATMTDNGDIFVTAINTRCDKETAMTTVQIRLSDGAGIKKAQAIFLTAPGGDIATQSGLLLGGAQIRNDGTWDGRWSQVEALDQESASMTIAMPPASAAVVRILKDH